MWKEVSLRFIKTGYILTSVSHENQTLAPLEKPMSSGFMLMFGARRKSDIKVFLTHPFGLRCTL
jgi:hypothetical protein